MDTIKTLLNVFFGGGIRKVNKFEILIVEPIVTMTRKVYSAKSQVPKNKLYHIRLLNFIQYGLQLGHCISLVSLVVKHHDQKHLGEEGVCLFLQLSGITLLLKEIREGTEGRN